MASIPEDIVERVKNEANIVDVIGDYVRLRRTGKNWLGLCPFHDDKRPSFNVEPVRGIYKCFACGKGGNVFTFLMELNNWTFPEVVRHLAQALGIEIPEDDRDRKEYSDNERLSAAVAEAAAFFRATLRSDRGVAAQAYFRKRGLTDETSEKFSLGYAPDTWDALINHLTEKGYSDQEIERAGLVVRRDGRGRPYDRFRGRAMFPIFSATGRIFGFGARRMTEDPDQPKYINSPESPVYQKSRLLYGLFQAKDAIRRAGMALMVEGYVDVISLHQAGITTAIAPCGTSLALEHADLIARYTSQVVLVFDSDQAGASATDRGIDVLLRKGLDVSVLRLPDGEDPDTYVGKFGAKEFERRVNESVSFLEFRARVLKQSGDLAAPERQADAIRSIVGSIALVPDPLKRELYVQKIAADNFLPEALMARELARALAGSEREEKRRNKFRTREAKQQESDSAAGSVEESAVAVEPGDGTLTEGPTTEATGDEVTESSAGTEDVGVALSTVSVPHQPLQVDSLPSSELGLLKVLMEGDPLMLEHVMTRIDPNDFAHPVTRGLMEVISGYYVNQRSFSIDELMTPELNPEVRELAAHLAIDRESISEYWSRNDSDLGEPNPWKAARDCLIQIQQNSIDRESRNIQDHLSNPELEADDEQEMLRRFRDLREKVENLKHLISG